MKILFSRSEKSWNKHLIFNPLQWFDPLRRVYLYIPSQKWDSESILYTSWWAKKLSKINHSEGAENIDFKYYEFPKIICKLVKKNV